MKVFPKAKVVFPKCRIIVHYMHGDADANTSEELDFVTFSDAKRFLEDILALKRVDPHDPEDGIRELAKQWIMTTDMVWEIYNTAVPTDCTSENYKAKITNIEIFGLTADGWYEFELEE